ncbi:2'-5' RNA ligase family protein [Christiangramia sabulilitoris]|uniref:2'-5' RNA ligase family protein n=1 Tax=Christiangramia sabulilitoris TaxID=2583991 RepID=UPI00140D9B6A|nr:2'-5' RNA ligase family protein [Christiangramia sabulilitoris]
MNITVTKHPLYFIAINPSEEINSRVESIKLDLKNKFGVQHALKLDAHITLQIPFRMPVGNEEILVEILTEFSGEHHSFISELDGFGRFAKNVVFIKIKDHEPYIKLHAELQNVMLNFLDLKSHEISSKIHPHITLATRDLKRSHFPQIWEYFNDKDLSLSFSAKDIQLLRHNGKYWTSLYNFSLNTQLNL